MEREIKREKLINFIQNVINANSSVTRATAYYADEHFVRVTFHRENKQMYFKLMQYCCYNELVIYKSNKATYETFIQL